MDILRQWALCLIIGAVAGTFVMAISPRGSTDKTVRAVVGIFVVAVICSPLADLINEDVSLNALAGFEYTENEDRQASKYMLEMFCKETEKIIISAADECNVAVGDICINADIDADDCIIIHEITVDVPMRYLSEKDAFSEFIFQKTGVAVTVNAE